MLWDHAIVERAAAQVEDSGEDFMEARPEAVVQSSTVFRRWCGRVVFVCQLVDRKHDPDSPVLVPRYVPLPTK